MSEKLSNLMNKNVTESDLDDFLRECKDDPSLIDSWQRYHLAGEVIRNEISEADFKFDVASTVMARLESETMESEQFDAQQSSVDKSNVIPLSSQPRSENDLTSKPLASKSMASKSWFPLALAASMLLGLYFFFQQPVIEPAPQQVVDNTAIESPISAAVDHWQTSNREIEDVLNSLLVEHSEFTSVTGMNGLGSYSKFIAYQN